MLRGWCQRLVSLLPLPGRVFQGHMCFVTLCWWTLFVCLFPVQSGVPGFLTDMQKACSNYASYCQKKWNATDGTAAHAQGLGFSLPVLALMIKLDFFFRWGGLLLVAVACCLLRHDVHDQPSSVIGWCWINSVPLYCTNWILCCLFCAIAVHSTFLQGSGAFIGYYLKTCLEFKHDSLIYCVATLGQRISSLYIYVYKLIYSVFSHTGNLKMTNLFCKTNVAWWASGDFFPMMSLLMQRRCHDTRCWFIVGAYDQRFWDLNSYCAVLHLYRWMWFYLVMTKSLLLCNTAVLLKWIKYYLKFGTEIRLIFSHLHWHWHTDVPVC